MPRIEVIGFGQAAPECSRPTRTQRQQPGPVPGYRGSAVPAGQDGGMASSISGAARELVRIVIHAVDAAISGHEVVTYDRAIARLASEPAGGRVLGDVLRSLLEDTHPDGFSSDDITLVVGRCYHAAVAWLPPERVDVTMLLAALAGALGIHGPGITYEALDLPRSHAEAYGDPDDTVPIK